MTRRQNHPLRALSAGERQEIERIARATSESATRVARVLSQKESEMVR